MSQWNRDIRSWVKEWFKKATQDQVTRTQNIAIREGWSPNRYNGSMKSELHSWLTDWYTLSVKAMPSPATLRKNPIEDPLHLLYKQILEGKR